MRVLDHPLAIAFACALALAPPTYAAGTKTPKPPVTKPVTTVDQFVTVAAGRGLASMELSDLALQRSESAAVRRLARQAHDEHARAVDTLRGLATGPGIGAAPPETIDLEQRGIKSRLAGLQGPAFDRAYVDALRTNDDRDIALYRAYGREARDPALQSWIADQLVTIRKRRQLIDAAALEVRDARP